VPDIAELQRRAEELLLGLGRVPASRPRGVGAPRVEFSPFVFEHLEQARALAGRFGSLVSGAPSEEEGLQAVLDDAEARRGESAALVEFALMIFITHDPRGARLPLPALEERHPEQLRGLARSVPRGVVETDREDRLRYFREDPLANQHHEHWHVVYPGGPDGPDRRSGELFFYMHQQMLARYDAERLSVGLPLVEPLADYRAPIAEGYDAHSREFSARPPDARLRDLTADYTVGGEEGLRDLIREAVVQGTFSNGEPVTPDLLGATEEPTADRADPAYGNHHGSGHILIAYLGDPPGPMAAPRSAIMDPVFFRWHRHVDDVLFEWQERHGGAVDLSDAPPVRLRSPGDAILVLAEDAPAGDALQPWAEQTFGGASWDDDFSATAPWTAELVTEMAERPGPHGPIPYLDHRDFAYVFRAENLADAETPVTVRVFLVPAEQVDNRRMWIELDKFGATLAPRAKAVIARPGGLASVVQKPVHRPPRPRRDPAENGASQTNYCNCGWPFNLLLPRGTTAGMPFRLLVLLTDGTVDRVRREGTCGSMSFCGVRDGRYPDARLMGYPFDRTFPDGVEATLAALENAALRDVTIRHAG
jgi:hypothetical protein